VTVRINPSVVIFDIRDRALWCSCRGWASVGPDVKNYKWRLNAVWHRMLYMATVVVTRQRVKHWSGYFNNADVDRRQLCVPCLQHSLRCLLPRLLLRSVRRRNWSVAKDLLQGRQHPLVHQPLGQLLPVLRQRQQVSCGVHQHVLSLPTTSRGGQLRRTADTDRQWCGQLSCTASTVSRHRRLALSLAMRLL